MLTEIDHVFTFDFIILGKVNHRGKRAIVKYIFTSKASLISFGASMIAGSVLVSGTPW